MGGIINKMKLMEFTPWENKGSYKGLDEIKASFQDQMNGFNQFKAMSFVNRII